MPPGPDADLPSLLRATLAGVGFTHRGVLDLLGPAAQAALSRHETAPALRRTGGGSPLETLVRLFPLQRAVPLAAAEAALPGLLGPLERAGIVEMDGGEVVARLDLSPYAADERDLWLVSDLTPGLDGLPIRTDADHVLGLSSAAISLAQLTVRDPVGRALDLGTGCGVQALHLATHAREVVATDVNPRAGRLTRFNAALNEAAVEVREGAWWEPVHGETFDLITCNPPFVISPATGERRAYRDSGLPGDQAVERLVRGAPARLADGGWCQVLGDWAIHRGQDWDERLAGWLDPGCDALVVQREVADPAAYVELWLKDAGLHGSQEWVRRYDDWLAWFDAQGIEAVGFGWVNLRRGGRTHQLLDWPYGVEQPVAPAISDWGRAVRTEVSLSTRPVTRVDVRQETQGAPGAADPESIVIRQQRGLRRARQVDTVEAALVGACDGDLTIGQILDALASLLHRDPAELRSTYLPVVAELVIDGFLLVADRSGVPSRRHALP